MWKKERKFNYIKNTWNNLQGISTQLKTKDKKKENILQANNNAGFNNRDSMRGSRYKIAELIGNTYNSVDFIPLLSCWIDARYTIISIDSKKCLDLFIWFTVVHRAFLSENHVGNKFWYWKRLHIVDYRYHMHGCNIVTIFTGSFINNVIFISLLRGRSTWIV